MEHTTEIPRQIYINVFNFIVFASILYFVLKKPVREYLATRRHTLEKAVEKASEDKIAAEAKLRDITVRLSKIETEVARVIHDLKEEGEREREYVIAQANQFSEKWKTDTDRAMAQELRKAQEALRSRTVTLALTLAEKMLREQMTPEDKAKMTQAYIDRLEHLN